MKHLLLLLLALGSFTLTAQVQDNDPLPLIGKKPLRQLDKEISGWCKSPDGQWLIERQKIPLRVNSRTSKKERSEERSLGEDNIEALELYPVVYGSDTLVMLVKNFSDGAFELQQTRRGWQKWQSLYYYIFSRDYLAVIRQSAKPGNSEVAIPLVANGQVNKTGGTALDAIAAQLNFNQPTDMQLIVKSRIRKSGEENQDKDSEVGLVQFQFYCLHPQSGDVEGVLKPLKINGKSIYSSSQLLDHAYYQVSAQEWQNFFLFEAAGVKL